MTSVTRTWCGNHTLRCKAVLYGFMGSWANGHRRWDNPEASGAPRPVGCGPRTKTTACIPLSRWKMKNCSWCLFEKQAEGKGKIKKRSWCLVLRLRSRWALSFGKSQNLGVDTREWIGSLRDIGYPDMVREPHPTF